MLTNYITCFLITIWFTSSFYQHLWYPIKSYLIHTKFEGSSWCLCWHVAYLFICPYYTGVESVFICYTGLESVFIYHYYTGVESVWHFTLRNTVANHLCTLKIATGDFDTMRNRMLSCQVFLWTRCIEIEVLYWLLATSTSPFHLPGHGTDYEKTIEHNNDGDMLLILSKQNASFSLLVLLFIYILVSAQSFCLDYCFNHCA